MEKSLMRGLSVLALVCASLFVVTSCAQKQVDVSEGIQPPVAKAQEQAAAGAGKEVVTQVAGDQLTPEMARKVQEFQNEKIYFDFDKSNLKPQAQNVLKKKAAFLRENPAFYVLIEGNCDNRGTEEYNLALGEKRAMAARDFLVTLGISGGRIKTISYGELRPADPANNEAAWTLNRRDEFKVYK